MVTFDASKGDVCTVKRPNTNTPLQALVLMTDPQYVEAARIMAERMRKEGGDDLRAQITYGFRLATGRRPKPAEVDLLVQLYQDEYRKFDADLPSADSLLAVGDYPPDPTLNRSETAALAMVASLMINHDEAYTKR